MKKLVLMMAIVFACGVTFASNGVDKKEKAKTEQTEKTEKAAKKEKKEGCSEKKSCCSEKAKEEKDVPAK